MTRFGRRIYRIVSLPNSNVVSYCRLLLKLGPQATRLRATVPGVVVVGQWDLLLSRPLFSYCCLVVCAHNWASIHAAKVPSGPLRHI
jgi:hypothetical protein